MTALETVAQFGEIFELQIPIGTRTGGDLLLIDPQGIAHVMEQAGDGVGRDGNAEFGQLFRDGGGSAARPAYAGHGITSGIMFEQAMENSDYVWRFFSVGVRPPPVRRVRPLTTF